MMRKLQFKNIDLIKSVEQRPMLWDRSCVLYNKLSKDRAWLEVCRELYPDFERFSVREQLIIATEVTAKWRNLRDAFVRSVRRKRMIDPTGQSIKTYVYYEHLQFLLQRKKRPGENTVAVVTQSNIEESVSESAEEENNSLIGNDIDTYDSVQSTSLSHEIELDPIQLMDTKRHMVMIPQQQQQQQQQQHPQQSDYPEQQDSPQPPQHHHYGTIDLHQEFTQMPDEDVSFFVSIIPSVRGLNEDEKLEFRIGTLELIRKLKRSRQEQKINRIIGGQQQGSSSGNSQNRITNQDMSATVKQEIDLE